MKIKKISLLIISLSFLLIGLISCASTSFGVDYNINLKSVERPKDTAERYGEYIISEQSESEKGKFLYEDDLIKSIWYVSSDQVIFDITNKTDTSIRIIWDEAAFVDDNGQSSRVMHSGTTYADRNNSLPPSVIVRKGSISDIIIPTDNVSYISGQYGGWRKLPLLSHTYSVEIEAEAKAKETLGKSIQVLLPLEISGKVNDYIFVFEIEDYSIKTENSYNWLKYL